MGEGFASLQAPVIPYVSILIEVLQLWFAWASSGDISKNTYFQYASSESLIWKNWDKSQDSILISSPNNSDTSSPYAHFEKHWPMSWSLINNGKFMLYRQPVT